MEVDRLLRDEEEAWAHLHATFETVPADRFEEATLTPEGWSPKDAMFHLAGWLADCARVLEQIREGTFDRVVEDARVIVDVNQTWFGLSRTHGCPNGPGRVRGLAAEGAGVLRHAAGGYRGRTGVVRR